MNIEQFLSDAEKSEKEEKARIKAWGFACFSCTVVLIIGFIALMIATVIRIGGIL